MLRILQVFWRTDRAGAETMLMNIYRHIDREKLQFDFVVHTDRPCAFDDEIRALGGRIYACPEYTGFNQRAYSRWWRNFFKEHPEYKVLHCHPARVAPTVLSQARRAGVRTVVHSHNTDTGNGVRRLILSFLQRGIRGGADRYLACSKPAAEWLFGKKIAASESCYVLNNGIEPELYKYDPNVRSEMRLELGISDKTVIGHTGRFNEVKNHSYIIDVFAEYKKLDPESVLLLAGDGPLRRQTEIKAESLGLADSVIFTGASSRVPELLSAMDVFIMPSLFEGLPLSIIEAQASGLNCLASDGIPADCNITGAVTFMPLRAGADEWAKKLSELVNPADRADRTGTVAAAGYDVTKNAAWMEDFYLGLFKKASPDCLYTDK